MDLDPILCRRAMLARDARFDGRFFVAVTSTGIYCRPICPARPPALAHCRFMPSAAAAQEAGFRPCLRCRPETAPGLGAWRGTSSTVTRAIALIEDGALDRGDTPALADRLGIGDRQLRRLFDKHVGASPVAVAQTRRVLLAKQLVHETDLSMTAIAHASGFGSVRRFNETFHALFARAPRELRRTTPRSVPAASITLGLGYRPPYDWPAMLAFLGARAIPGVEAVRGQTYARVIALDGHLGTIAVTPDPARNRLSVTIRYPCGGGLTTIVTRLRRMFDLDADPQVVDEVLARDPRLAPRVSAHPGLRLPGAWDGFELGVRAILGQQVSVAAASRLAGGIAERHGAAFTQDNAFGLTRAFPTPAVLADATLAGMPRARAATIAALAVVSAGDPTLFERGADLDASLAKLRGVPGIGDWTAAMIAMRAMREPDAFPAADLGLSRACAGETGRPNAAALLAQAEAWRPWRAYAALHLWAGPAGTAVAKKRTETDDALAA